MNIGLFVVLAGFTAIGMYLYRRSREVNDASFYLAPGEVVIGRTRKNLSVRELSILGVFLLRRNPLESIVLTNRRIIIFGDKDALHSIPVKAVESIELAAPDTLTIHWVENGAKNRTVVGSLTDIRTAKELLSAISSWRNEPVDGDGSPSRVKSLAAGFILAQRESWRVDNLGFGQDVFRSVPEAERPRWAAHFIEAFLNQGGVPRGREVDSLLEIVSDRKRWPEAHAAFQAIRRLNLENERSRGYDEKTKAFLDVAETVAKVTYNAVGPTVSAPFDYHVGWRLAGQVKRLCLAVGDKDLEERCWKLLTEHASKISDADGSSA